MKKRVLTAVLAAALVTGTCAATVSAKEEKTSPSVSVSWFSMMHWMPQPKVLRMPSPKRWVIL